MCDFKQYQWVDQYPSISKWAQIFLAQESLKRKLKDRKIMGIITHQ